MRIRRASPGRLGDRLGQLIADIESRQGAPPFGEILLAAMEASDHESLGLVAEHGGVPVAYGFAAPGPDRDVWTLELAADPPVYDRLLEQMLERLEATGVTEAILWAHSPAVEPPAEIVHPERTLYRMSVTLPISDQTPHPEGITIRGLDTRRDASALIEVNNRAFEDHPEQGGWKPRDLETRLAFSWFDPAGVRTAWAGTRMVAFHWTKVHPEPGPDGETVGEIYSIAVDPTFQRRGLGRAIAVEGLQYLATGRGAGRAILYVDASNTAALTLYRSLGFETEHVDRAYRWTADR